MCIYKNNTCYIVETKNAISITTTYLQVDQRIELAVHSVEHLVPVDTSMLLVVAPTSSEYLPSLVPLT